jgi:hypothetical protein
MKYLVCGDWIMEHGYGSSSYEVFTHILACGEDWDSLKPDLVDLYLDELFNESNFETGDLTRKYLTSVMLSKDIDDPDSLIDFAIKNSIIKEEVPRYEEMGLNLHRATGTKDLSSGYFIRSQIRSIRMDVDYDYLKDQGKGMFLNITKKNKTRILLIGDQSELGKQMGESFNIESADNFSKFWEYPVDSTDPSSAKVKDFYSTAYDSFNRVIGSPGKNLMGFSEKYLPLLKKVFI